MRHLRFISRNLSRIPKPNPTYPSRTVKSPPLDARPSSVLNTPNFAYSTQQQESKPSQRSDRVTSIVDEISTLTLLEVSDLTEVLRKKLNIEEMPIMAVMMPGMGFGVRGAGKGPGVGGGAAKGEEVKKEKTAFDLKLEGFDAANKIKVIKEVRACTDLGLKEAKDLVEKTPTLLKKGVAKEEAEKIIEKMKEVGAKVLME